MIGKAEKRVQKLALDVRQDLIIQEESKSLFKRGLTFFKKTMVKILHATDVHTDLKKYEAIVNQANNSEVDAVLITGDLTDKDSKAYGAFHSIAFINAVGKIAG